MCYCEPFSISQLSFILYKPIYSNKANYNYKKINLTFTFPPSKNLVLTHLGSFLLTPGLNKFLEWFKNITYFTTEGHKLT